MKQSIEIWNRRMAAHSQDTDGFKLDLYAECNNDRILNASLVFSETIDFAVWALRATKPSQRAALKNAIQYLTAFQQRQSALRDKQIEAFEVEQAKYITYLNKRKNGK